VPSVRLAARLPGKALAVWLLVQHVQRLNRTRGAVTLPDALVANYGISDEAKVRAIHALSQVGLLSVGDQGKGVVPGCCSLSIYQPSSVSNRSPRWTRRAAAYARATS
jgi:hypothetical protein